MFVVLVIVASSNAVNLTDGLDGLAIGCTIIAAGALTVLTYVSGHAVFSDYLEIDRDASGRRGGPYFVDPWSARASASSGTTRILLKCSWAMSGRWRSEEPLARLPSSSSRNCFLPFVGGIFVLETLSVILQVGSYKLRNGKRIFKMAPLHHHFELSGWSESKVITRFWILALVFALLALTTLKLR